MGYVREVKAQSGDRVQAGQLLVEIDARDLDTQIRQAEAARNEARNAADEVSNAIASAKANLELSSATFKRMDELFQKKSISNQEFDEASARMKVARAGYDSALAKQQQVKSKIQQADEAVQAAVIMRGYAKLHAPFAGVVTERKVEPGSLAAPGTPLLVIEQAGGYRSKQRSKSPRRPLIKPGTPVTVYLDALQKSVKARVSEIVPVIDSASRAYGEVDCPRCRNCNPECSDARSSRSAQPSRQLRFPRRSAGARTGCFRADSRSRRGAGKAGHTRDNATANESKCCPEFGRREGRLPQTGQRL